MFSVNAPGLVRLFLRSGGAQQPHVKSIPKHPLVDIVCWSAHTESESINSERLRRNRKSAHARPMGGWGGREVGIKGGSVREMERVTESDSE